MNKDFEEKLKKFTQALKARKLLLILLLAGLVILMIPTGSEKTRTLPEETAPTEPPEDDLEARLEDILSQIDGAGKVTVLLTLYDDGERVLARNTRGDESSALTVSEGSGVTGEVEVSYRYPVYRGAVVCAEGAGSAQVRLELMEAVKAATGLGAEAIKIVKMGATPE